MEPADTATGSIDDSSVASVLSEMAHVTSETLELQDVIDRVAAALRRIIPFDNMGVVRILDSERAVLHAGTFRPQGGKAEPTESIPLSSWSPRMRPRPGPNPRIEDALVEFDPAFPIDAMALKGGVRSGMWEPFRSTDTLRGGIFLSAYRPHAFTETHQNALRPVAALLGSAIEHWQIWDAERRRRERLDAVERVLGTLAESLDVREVFHHLSTDLKSILPHDLMNLTEVDLRARRIQVVAFAGEFPVRTDPFPLEEGEVESYCDFAIVRDILAELSPERERYRLIRSSGMRSWLHVPVWLSGEVKGSLSFLHREPSRYGSGDAEVALRVASRVAVSLSHHRLAEEAEAAARARERAARLEARVEALARELAERESSWVVGISRSWKDALRHVGRVATSGTTVLITGESGTGKEVIAKLIHQGSQRADRDFVAINCAALPEQLLESELFGHEKGAFTGATTTKIGRIEQAESGTLFLDEIAEMSPQLQAKFLRVLEQREYQRVGGVQTRKADVRVIAATNRDLAGSIARQTFREDLFYRLNVFQIHIAPLRERPEDILPLAEAFLEDLGRTMGRSAAGISRDAREWLATYSWPGNVRELRNAIERAILLCDGGLITHEHLPAPISRSARAPVRGSLGAVEASLPEGVDLATAERTLIERALAQSRGNKSKAARLLGLTRSQLYSRLERHGL